MNDASPGMSEELSCKNPNRNFSLSFRAVKMDKDIIVGAEINGILCLTEDAIHERIKNSTDKLIGEWKNWIEKNKD